MDSCKRPAGRLPCPHSSSGGMQLTVPMLLVDTWLLVASMRRLMPKSQILQVNPARNRRWSACV